MSSLTLDHLIALERSGWDSLCSSSGDDFYGALMTEDGVMILANGVVLDRDAVVESLQHAPAWDEYELHDVRVVRLGRDAAVLVYRARARRGEDPPFEAWMASTYRLIDNELRLALYQQTTATH